MLIVDDNSPDGTGEIADRLADEGDDVAVLHRELKEGLGPAYIAGFRRGARRGRRADRLEMDSDFSHDPAHLPAILAAAEDADEVDRLALRRGRRGHRLGSDAALRSAAAARPTRARSSASRSAT